MSKLKNISETITTADIQKQRIIWHKKKWSIPELKGGKHTWFPLVVNLVTLIESKNVTDLDICPDIHGFSKLQTWRMYVPFLKHLELISIQSENLILSESGLAFYKNPSKIHLAELIQEKFRLFGEILKLLSIHSATVADVNEIICKSYSLNWKHLANTRKRMDWLEVLNLIEDVGSNKWVATSTGKSLLEDWCIITPQTLEMFDSNLENIKINEPPKEIAALIQELYDSPELHLKRKTYNLWVPSPNKIDNLRTIIQASLKPISREDFFYFIEQTFSLKTSSVESMLPFLKASGLLEEIRRKVYCATSAAKAWVNTNNDLDFIRILHVHMQFVGEIIIAAEKKTERNTIYSQATLYGLNQEKARWITGFLLEAGLLYEPQYLHLKATPTGLHFASTLPLAKKKTGIDKSTKSQIANNNMTASSEELNQIIKRLTDSSKNPTAEGKQPGVAFEESIASIFHFMGFDSQKIGGSGDTDVTVRWQDEEGHNITAILDGKSKSTGNVTHSDISDVAIDSHKDTHQATYVGIVGPDFSGNTIKNLARKKKYVLITAHQLSQIAFASDTLGLSPMEIGLIFQVPNGFSKLEKLIIAKQRELEIITIVISNLNQDQEILGGLSARDIFLLHHKTDITLSQDEILAVMDTLSKSEIGAIRCSKQEPAPEHTTYVLNNAKTTANRLRALASTIDTALFN